MRILSVELNNIRSYINDKVFLPKGITLLAGDIGAGKSTILLAIEFALFGIIRGELSGGVLLRHGCQEGSVVLELEVDSKRVLISRGLRRTSSGVSQDAGFIEVGGVRTSLTAVELKAKVLEILGYPEGLLNKNKSLLFRYTVYTPQEDMKRILFERSEDRLVTLRKLFGIEKYKIVKDNSLLLIKNILRPKSEFFLGESSGIDELQSRVKLLFDESRKIEASINEVKSLLRNESSVLVKAKKEVEALEKLRFEVEESIKRKAVLEAHKEQLLNEKKRLASEMKSLPKKPVLGFDDSEISSLTKLKEAEKEIRRRIEENSRNGAKIEGIIERSRGLIDKISSLKECPTCRQVVYESHKSRIRSEEEARIITALKKSNEIRAANDRLRKQLEDLLLKIGSIEKKRSELVAFKERLKAFDELVRRFEFRKVRLKEINNEVLDIDKKLSEIKIVKFDGALFFEKKEFVNNIEKNINSLMIKKARLEERLESMKKESETLKKQINDKKRSREHALKIQKIIDWLNKNFIPLMTTIEKHLLISSYHIFNESFKEWFDTLIEDEGISVRLDADFSPLVEQNGYEIPVGNLSGGERTAVALAYRLALNRTVNSVSKVKTEGLLILDEPTDGFSSEQLDRVRELLKRLSLDQIIIVSHEQKVEGFVDNIIRVVKNDHESKILT